MFRTTRTLLQLLPCLLLAGALCVPGSVFAKDKKDTLYVYNWSDYMDPDIIKDFEAKYDVKVVTSLFNSNSELFAKLRSGGDRQYDIIIPSNYYVPRLVAAKLIQPLQKDLIPNFDNLLDKFKDPAYDADSHYSVPYQWGDTGIAYNADVFPDPPKSWKLLLDPDVNPSHPFAITKDSQGAIAAACAYLGLGFTCDNVDDWQQAARLMIKTKHRKNFVGFVAGTPALQQLSRGAVDAAVTYNGDYVYEKKKDPDGFANIRFMIPEEGAELWIDTMAIPAHAPHPELAHKFINFILDPEVGARLSNFNFYSSPNAAAQEFLDPELEGAPITPTADELDVLHVKPILEGDQLQALEQLWTEIQSD